MQYLYETLFSTDVYLWVCEGEEIIIKPGMRVCVYSESNKCWYDDGYVVSTYRNGITVSYNHKTYSSWLSATRGSQKYLTGPELQNTIRLPEK